MRIHIVGDWWDLPCIEICQFYQSPSASSWSTAGVTGYLFHGNGVLWWEDCSNFEEEIARIRCVWKTHGLSSRYSFVCLFGFVFAFSDRVSVCICSPSWPQSPCVACVGLRLSGAENMAVLHQHSGSPPGAPWLRGSPLGAPVFSF